jgi:hypothetical protein
LLAISITRHICCDKKRHNKQTSPEATNLAMPLHTPRSTVLFVSRPGKEDDMNSRESRLSGNFCAPERCGGSLSWPSKQKSTRGANNDTLFKNDLHQVPRKLWLAIKVVEDISISCCRHTIISLTENPEFRRSRFDVPLEVTIPRWKGGRPTRQASAYASMVESRSRGRPEGEQGQMSRRSPGRNQAHRSTHD